VFTLTTKHQPKITFKYTFEKGIVDSEVELQHPEYTYNGEVAEKIIDTKNEQFVRRMRHGTGRCLWKDADEYTGDWKEDKMHGEGTLESISGEMYKGSFKKNMRHGKGELHNSEDEIIKGIWCDDNLAEVIPDMKEVDKIEEVDESQEMKIDEVIIEKSENENEKAEKEEKEEAEFGEINNLLKKDQKDDDNQKQRL
jgi:hypothetical protein